MKRFFFVAAASALMFCSAVFGAVSPSNITVNGASLDPTSTIQYLNNPLFPGGITTSGTITQTGGITSISLAPLLVPNIPLGPVALASIGTNTTDVSGQLWVTDIFVPANRTVTGIGFLQGGTATTDNFLVAIYSGTGVLLGNSNTAGVVLSGANTFQQQALLSSITLPGPATYFIAIQGNGTASGAIQTVPATYPQLRTGSISGTFGTVPSTITVPTTFTAAKAPVVYLY